MEQELKKDTKFYVEALYGNECFCGKGKRPGDSFCYSCYKSLPQHMQQDLYQRLFFGYEEAYDAAVAWLT